MKPYYTILFFLIFASSSKGQSILKGTVLDSATKLPITGVNVFLSTTSLGTSTDEKGNFSISRVPQGKYELICTALNYTTLVTQVQINQLEEKQTIYLSSSANVLKEVIVESYDSDGWERWGDYFKENFIGKNTFLKNCYLKNPSVVKFKYNRRNNTVRAFAHENLQFENNNLGYTIDYLLINFEFNLNDNQFKFTGYPLFKEMTSTNTDQLKKWKITRLDTYKGSLMYFIRSLFANQLQTDGYEMYPLIKVDDFEKKRVKQLYKNYQEELKNKGQTNILPKDSLDYYSKVAKLSSEENKVILDKQVNRDEILFKVDVSISKDAYFFEFDNSLHVSYVFKKEPYEYTKFMNKRPYKDNISSDISLPFNKGVTIFKNGSYYFGENIFLEGYWAWSEKLSTMLPFNYGPKE
jgi:CarboxypepD_reg-like domain